MSKQDDILAGDFGLADEVAPVTKSADAETLVTRLEDRFSDSMTLLKRIPVTLTLEVSSVEIMLADLLNIDDDTVIELDKLAGEPLDIKVNNILLGKAEVVVVNEKYGLRVLEFNTRACAGGVGPGRRYCAAYRGHPRQHSGVQRQNSGTDSDDPRRFAADDGADDDLLYALYYRAVAAAPGARATTNAAKPHSDWHCALPHHAGDAPHLAQYLRPRSSAV